MSHHNSNPDTVVLYNNIMKLFKQRIEEVKTLFFNGDSLKQKAEVTIRYVNDSGLKNDGIWEFIHCKFTTEEHPYSLSDFEFLSSVNEKIKELIK